MKRHFSLFSWLVFIIVFSSMTILAIVFATNRYLIRQQIVKMQEEQFTLLMNASVYEMNAMFRDIESVVRDHVAQLLISESVDYSRASEVLTSMLKSHPDIFGGELIFADAIKNHYPFEALYALQHDNDVSIIDRDDPGADRREDWYQIPLTTRKPSWCDPYLDTNFNVLMITYSVLITDEQGEALAVLTADVSLERLEKLLHGLPVGETGEPILLSTKQVFIVHSNKDWVFRESLISLAEKTQDGMEKDTLTELSRQVETRDRGSVRYHRPGSHEIARCYFQHIPRLGVTLGCILPEKELYQTIYKINRWGPLFGLVTLVLMFLPALFIARSIATPLQQLRKAASEVGSGHLGEKIERKGIHREIVALIDSFESMQENLAQHIEELTAATATKERFSVALSAAHEIQLGMVPQNFSKFQKAGINVFASLTPALAVGGDFYDFAYIDCHHFYFCLGDVSGKGIPASLYMAVGLSLMKSSLFACKNPAQALEQVNKELFARSEGAVFITAICGILDRGTGLLTMASAGHLPPVLIAPNGTRYIDIQPALPLAVDSDAEYENVTAQLNPGEQFFLYSDGVTDAADILGDLFGSQRLLSTLTEIRDNNEFLDGETTITQLRQSIADRVQGAPQSDDLTMLVFGVAPVGDSN